jgi:O-antigen/teichoic acid export membrane protein
MISGILLPHLSHDWESDRRGRVTFRLNLFLKLTTLGLFAVAAVVLAIAPILFNVVFHGKFASGSAALPGMLAATVWFSAGTIAQLYICCAERVSYVGIALAAGLAVNVTVNLLLLPTLGLTSAVLAAGAANVVTLLLVLYFAQRLGFRVELGVWILLLAVQFLYVGHWTAIIALAVLLLLAFRTGVIFNRDEKDKILEKRDGYLSKIRTYFRLPNLNDSAVETKSPGDYRP